MRHFKSVGVISVLLGVTLTTPASAVDIYWKGFGSAVGGKAISQEDLVGGGKSTYSVNPTLTGLPNSVYDDYLTFRPDSNFGLQMTAAVDKKFEVTAQLTARGAKDFEVEAEWMYASYDITPKLTGSIGRQRLPLYIYSDFLDVGFAYHWLRPPLDVYGEGVSTFEGASGFYKDYMGDWDYDIQLYLGSTHNETAVTGETRLENLIGTIVTFSKDSIKLRGSVHSANGWSPGTPLADKDNKQDLTFFSLGAVFDKGSFFIMSEWTLLTINDFGQSSNTPGFPTYDERESWMISTGVRFNKVTPHITYSSRDTILTGDSVPILNDLVIGSKTLNVGLRWGFHPQAAFKIDYTSASDESDELLVAGGKKGEVDVIAAGIDFIF